MKRLRIRVGWFFIQVGLRIAKPHIKATYTPIQTWHWGARNADGSLTSLEQLRKQKENTDVS